MKKNPSIALVGILTSTLLIGCEGELDLANPSGSQNPDTNAMNMRIPKSLQGSDDADSPTTEESTDPADIPAATKEAVDDVEAIAGSLDRAVVGASSEALYLGAELLNDRVEFAQETLAEIDGVWEQIGAYCGSVAPGSDCDIPAGTLTLAVDDEGESALLEDAIVYKSNPDDTYAHSVVRRFDGDFSETEQIRWNNDRSLIAMGFESSWTDEDGAGMQSSDLQYTASDQGDRISLRDEFVLGNEKFTDIQQLHHLNDGLNGVEIKTEFNWSDGYTTGKWQSQAVANDEGGKLVTTASFDDEDLVWHARETFDADGELVSSEYCEQTASVDCSDPANWNSEDIDNSAEWYDIDIESAGEDLEEAYELACEAMELDEEDCGFSDSDISVLNGAVDIFDNTDDVTVYLCVETGEDELACRAQENAESESTHDGEEVYSEALDFDIEESIEGEVCDDCEYDEHTIEAIDALLESGDLDDLIEALDADEFDLAEFDLTDIDSADDLDEIDLHCDDDIDACEAEFEGVDGIEAIAVEDISDIEECVLAENHQGEDGSEFTDACAAITDAE